MLDEFDDAKTALLELPERYSPELYDQKRDDLYWYIYKHYADAEHNIYAVG